MIHSIDSNHPKFKKIQFEKGFNIVVAERTQGSNKKDSRNGLGKSTMINIIHFCLGGKLTVPLNNAQLADITFVLEIDLDGKRYTLSRNTKQNQIYIDGDIANFPIKPKEDDTGKYFMAKDQLRKILGNLMFDLPTDLSTFNPTFGSMISYFMRKQEGYQNPFKQSSIQQLWDVNTNNAYLLNLGWKIITKMQILKEKQTGLNAFKHEITVGQFAGFMGNMGELEAEKIKLEMHANSQRQALEKFQINEQYEEIEKTANDITQTIHDKSNQNIADKLLLERYNISIKEEKDTDLSILTKIYQEAGMYFPDNITKTLEQVSLFHHKIIQNRKDFLHTELDQLTQNITKRTEQIQQLDNKKADLIIILETHGALKEYTHIQKNYNNSLTELNEIKTKLANVKKIENESNQLKIDKQQLYKEILLDTKERESQKNKAIRIFGDFSSYLYSEFGTLVINPTESGFGFDVHIRRSSSQGIGNMKIFCYDLTLAKLWSAKNRSPGFLIHDSMIFDGVDERQIAGALQLAKNTFEKTDFQYICTMNSDMIPKNDLVGDFQLKKYTRRTLTDSTIDGGILGIRI